MNLVKPIRLKDEFINIKFLPEDLRNRIQDILPDEDFITPENKNQLSQELQDEASAAFAKVKEDTQSRLARLPNDLLKQVNIVKTIPISYNDSVVTLLQELLEYYTDAIEAIEKLKALSKINIFPLATADETASHIDFTTLNKTIDTILECIQPIEIFTASKERDFENGQSFFSFLTQTPELKNLREIIIDNLAKKVNESDIPKDRKIEFNEEVLSSIISGISEDNNDLTLFNNFVENYNIIDNPVSDSTRTWIDGVLDYLNSIIDDVQDHIQNAQMFGEICDNPENCQKTLDSYLTVKDYLENIKKDFPQQ